MSDLFEGPYTLEGILQFLRTTDDFRADSYIGEKLYLFPDQELVRIFEELKKPGDVPNVFDEFNRAKKFPWFRPVNHANFPRLSPGQVKLIFETLSKDNEGCDMGRFFTGISLSQFAREGLEKLLDYLEYRKALEQERVASEEAANRLAKLGPVTKRLIEELSNHGSYQNLVNFVCKALPQMTEQEFRYLIADADRMLPGWNLSVEQFRALPREHQRSVCAWLFQEDRFKCLYTIERYILDQPTMVFAWRDVLLSENRDAIWTAVDTNRRSPARRDASPKRVSPPGQ